MSGAVSRVAARLELPETASWFRAPGRVNLIGDHTDYNEGFVLPVAIDLDCVVAALPGASVRVTSLELDDAVELPPDGGGDLAAESRGWARLVVAVAQELARIGRPPVGVDALVASDVPIGSGLSSSAAFEVVCAVALAAAGDWDADPVALARACRAAEERATGVPCGIMDQLVALVGRAGCALLIDCRSLETRAVALPEKAAALVVHSGQPRTLAGSAYGERRRGCEALAQRLGVPALRDATPAQVADEPLGRHVVSENERVLAAVAALESGDLARLGSLLSASHTSLRDDFRVSTRELDALVEELVAAGAYGARLTGAGFGGSVVAICDSDAVARVSEVATARYRRRTGREPQAFTCRAVDGAGPLAP